MSKKLAGKKQSTFRSSKKDFLNFQIKRDAFALIFKHIFLKKIGNADFFPLKNTYVGNLRIFQVEVLMTIKYPGITKIIYL
jgi:hypothetical protein